MMSSPTNGPLLGTHVRLEPLSPVHVAPMADVGLDPELWRWTASRVHTPAEMRAYVATALLERDQGRALPFATVERASGRVVGCTRFGHVDLAHRRAELGWTWIARPWQGTPVSREATYLLLRLAFEEMGWMRVEFRADVRNERSRGAIRRRGATEEGTFRRHMVMPGGRVRDTVCYSIVDAEWPRLRRGLESRLGIGTPIAAAT